MSDFSILLLKQILIYLSQNWGQLLYATEQCTLVMCGNSSTLVLEQSPSTNCIISDLSPYS